MLPVYVRVGDQEIEIGAISMPVTITTDGRGREITVTVSTESLPPGRE